MARVIIPMIKSFGVKPAQGNSLLKLAAPSTFFLVSLNASGINKIVPINEITNPAISIYTPQILVTQ